MLDALLERGYRYAFVSNADNLGAVLEPRILAWIAREEIPFVMEVADRTEADRKGGHIARRRDGDGLVLREIAQTPDEDVDAFQDVARHRFFNTNTLWVDLAALRALLDERDGVLGLPMIVNRKTVDPSDKSLARGRPARDRDGRGDRRLRRRPRAARAAAPVRAGQDDERPARAALGRLRAHRRRARRAGRGPRRRRRSSTSTTSYYKLLADFEERFPAGAPSLVACDRLTVEGDVEFGADVAVRGAVTVEHDGDGRMRIEDGTVLEG